MRKKLIRSGIVLILGMIFSSPAFTAERASALTLTEAISRAIHTSPEYGIVANEKNIAVEQLSEIRAQYLPSVDFQAQGGRVRTSSPVLSGTQSLWEHGGSLTLTQLLFDGLGTQRAVKSQTYRVESATHRVQEATEFLGLDVVQAYLEILRQRSLLTIASTNMNDHLNIFDKVKAGGDAGTITNGDVVQVEARANNARANLSMVEQELRNAEAFFIQKVGEMPGKLAPPPIPRKKLHATIEETLSTALIYNQTLAVYDSDIKSAQAEYEGTASAFFPKVDLEVKKSHGINQDGISGNQNGLSALAVMRWNFSHGGADAARRNEFRYRQAVAKQRAARALRQVEKDIRDTWAARDSAASRAREFSHQSKANEKVVGVYMDQFTVNRRSLLDVLNAQNELFSSRTSYMNALYAEDFAVFRLLALEGKMLNVLGIELPREARLEGR